MTSKSIHCVVTGHDNFLGTMQMWSQQIMTWDFAFQWVVRSKVARSPEAQAKFGRWTHDRLLSLGPTYVKLGQLASTRRDLFDPLFVKELESLQDDVTPMEASALNAVMQAYGQGFRRFRKKPEKSASLGQVHLAQTWGGKTVIVKVQRPGIREVIESDIVTLNNILSAFNVLGISRGAGPDVNELLNESLDYLLLELDYRNELSNNVDFHTSAIDVDNAIRVPRVSKKLSTETVWSGVCTRH